MTICGPKTHRSGSEDLQGGLSWSEGQEPSESLRRAPLSLIWDEIAGGLQVADGLHHYSTPFRVSAGLLKRRTSQPT
jgi:hypothetical protein